MKRLAIIFLVMVTSQSVFPQGKKLLVHTEGAQYLRLKIETYLRNLTDTIGNEARSSLTKVESLNGLLKSDRIQSEIRSAISTFDPDKALAVRSEDEQLLNKIAKSLNEYDLFLSVRVTSLSYLIEYQLELFQYSNAELLEGENITYFKLLDPKAIATANFFINPKKDGYLIDLNDGIRSLFRSASVLPDPVIHINGKQFGSQTITIGLNDSIILDASQSKYLGEDFSNLKFEWTLLEFNGNRPNEIQQLDFIQNSTVQSVSFPYVGKYKIGLKIWDGIAYSREQYTIVDVIKNPILHVRTKLFHSSKQGILSDALLGTKHLGKSIMSKPSKGTNYIASTSGQSDLNYSYIKNYKTESEKLEKAVGLKLIRGSKQAVDSSIFQINSIDDLGNEIYRHNFEVNFVEPGDYWMTVHDEYENVDSERDTINFRYYYRLPFEIDIFSDYTTTIFNDFTEEYARTAFVGFKFYFIRQLSLDVNFAAWHNRQHKTEYVFDLSRFGVSVRYSNTIFKLLLDNNSADPFIDGYLGIYTNDFSSDNIFVSTGLKIAPHKHLLNRNMHLEYFLGMTVNYGPVLNPFGFQYGVTLTPLMFK